MPPTRRTRQRIAHGLLTVLVMLWAGATSRSSAHAAQLPPHENLHATLWVQSSAEWQALARQAYSIADRALADALASPTWTAAIEQTGDCSQLPPAVVVDVDETVLDNSYYEAQLIRDQGTYDAVTWDPWVLTERATAVPGALDFLKHAHERGVTVFYVTNRKSHLREATRRNLAALGFPLVDNVETVLSRTDTRDKGPRRAAVAEQYRVLLLIGDNNDDFASAFEDKTPAERRKLVDEFAPMWGSRWIVIPNPTYGSWEGAVVDYKFDVGAEVIFAKKYEALIFEPGEDEAARIVRERIGLALAIDEPRLWGSTLSAKIPYGFRVATVDPDSLAAKAGMQAGDILLEWNGRAIRSILELTAWLASSPRIEVHYMRQVTGDDGQPGGEWRKFDTELSTTPRSAKRREAF